LLTTACFNDTNKTDLSENITVQNEQPANEVISVDGLSNTDVEFSDISFSDTDTQSNVTDVSTSEPVSDKEEPKTEENSLSESSEKVEEKAENNEEKAVSEDNSTETVKTEEKKETEEIIPENPVENTVQTETVEKADNVERTDEKAVIAEPETVEKTENTKDEKPEETQIIEKENPNNNTDNKPDSNETENYTNNEVENDVNNNTENTDESENGNSKVEDNKEHDTDNGNNKNEDNGDSDSNNGNGDSNDPDSSENKETPKVFTVIFRDWDGTELKNQTVNEGESASSPEAPTRSGYEFVGWDKPFDNITADTVITAVYGEITVNPYNTALSVSGATASAGTDVAVTVNIGNNPGFLTMALQIEYDSSILTLTKISNGSDFGDYTFTAPKNKSSGCKVAWFATDLPEETVDGTLMTLKFTVSSEASAGNYPITVSCTDDGSTLDGNMVSFLPTAANGYITVN